MLRDLFSDTYFLIPLLSGVGGLLGAYHWHFVHTNVGKALLLFSAGLLLQTIGQISYSAYYLVFGIENPYLTFGEIFYLSSLFVFLIGFAYMYIGMGVSLPVHRKFSTQAMIIIVLFMLATANIALLLKPTFFGGLLVIGYPTLGVALTCLMVYLFISTWSTLEGAFRQSFLLLSMAFTSLLAADALYLSETYRGTWQAAGISDTVYLIAYISLGLGLTTLGNKFYKPQDEPIAVFFSYESLLK